MGHAILRGLIDYGGIGFVSMRFFFGCIIRYPDFNIVQVTLFMCVLLFTWGKFTRVFNSCLNMWIKNVVGWIRFLSRLGCKAAGSIHIRKRGMGGSSLSVYDKYEFFLFFLALTLSFLGEGAPS